MNSKEIEVKDLGVIIIRRLKETSFITFIAMLLFLFLSLGSYNVNDPGWSHTGINNEPTNVAGLLGAYIADVLLSVFGYLGYFMPVIIAANIAILFKRVALTSKIAIFCFKLLGSMFLIIGGCGLAATYVPIVAKVIPQASGGITGNFVEFFTLVWLGNFGSTLFLSAAAMIGASIVINLSWLQIIGYLGDFCLFIADKIRVLLKYCLNSCLKFATHTAGAATAIAVPDRAVATTATVADTINTRNTGQLKVNYAKIANFTVEAKSKVNAVNNPHLHHQANATTELKSQNILPDVMLLQENKANRKDDFKHLSKTVLDDLSAKVERILADFGIEAKVVAVYPGPVITRFELGLKAGVKVSRISTLVKDIARSLSVSSVRVVEVIPGKSVIGLEIPNQEREIVRLRDIIESSSYKDSYSPLTLALGKDIAGYPVITDLAKMPHLLVAGTTGSGKSVGVNAMLLSIIYKATAEDVRLLLIDPKMLELSIYEGIPHLLAPVVTDMKDAADALKWCIGEMERRYQLMAMLGVRNLTGFNQTIMASAKHGNPIADPLWVAMDTVSNREEPKLTRLPRIVVIIDEFADMMMVVGKKVEELIARLAQKARAAGIHMILATQRPSVDVITGLIKANIPTRIAFQVSSKIDSRTILDQMGAEQLLGNGDMLYLPPGIGIATRIHGAFVSDDEVHRVVSYLRNTGKPNYIEELCLKSSVNVNVHNGRFAAANQVLTNQDFEAQDELYDEAVAIVAESRRTSVSNLQRRLKIGYNRAARLVETMEACGILSAVQVNGLREVLIPPANSDPTTDDVIT